MLFTVTPSLLFFYCQVRCAHFPHLFLSCRVMGLLMIPAIPLVLILKTKRRKPKGYCCVDVGHVIQLSEEQAGYLGVIGLDTAEDTN